MMKNFFKSGKHYFFKRKGKTQYGILQYCEECGAPCCVNTVTITQAPSKIVAKKMNSDMDNCEEMTYSEETGLNTCESCYQ